MAEETIFLTGGTGFLGQQILHRLIARPNTRVLMLVRPRSDASGPQAGGPTDESDGNQTRFDFAGPVQVVSGDVTRERCGLSDADWDLVTSTATRIVHAAATVRFDVALDEARKVNVEGTRRVLALAETAHRAGPLRQITYVGTAFVAGCREGLVREDDLDAGQRFRNAYEQSKYEAETLVRAARARLPIAIARPSIIVGDSRTGVATTFKTIYWPLRIYATGRWRTVPGSPAAVLDIVPVDFVADAVVSLAFDERAAGTCAHLCAGPDRTVTIGEVGRLASTVFDQRPPRFVPPALCPSFLMTLVRLALGSRGKFLRDGRVYRPYFRLATQFDTSTARRLLQPAGIEPPAVRDYLERLLLYARQVEWKRGKRKAEKCQVPSARC